MTEWKSSFSQTQWAKDQGLEAGVAQKLETCLNNTIRGLIVAAYPAHNYDSEAGTWYVHNTQPGLVSLVLYPDDYINEKSPFSQQEKKQYMERVCEDMLEEFQSRSARIQMISKGFSAHSVTLGTATFPFCVELVFKMDPTSPVHDNEDDRQMQILHLLQSSILKLVSQKTAS